MQTNKTLWGHIKNIDMRAIPIELLILYGFSVIVTVLSFIGLFSALFLSESFLTEIYETVVPFTGGFSPSYFFIAFVAPILFVSKPADKIRKMLIYFVILEIAMGCFSFLISLRLDNTENPYLLVSNWRFLWSFLIPGIWMYLLISPRVKTYFT